MMNNNSDCIPTLAECIDEYKTKKPLLDDIKVLETRRIRLEAQVKCLQITEELLLQSVIKLSRDLAQLSEKKTRI